MEGYFMFNVVNLLKIGENNLYNLGQKLFDRVSDE